MTGLHKLFIAGLLAFGLLAGGLQVPVIMKQKDIAHDRQVVTDLARISEKVENARSKYEGLLPKSLADTSISDELKDSINDYKYLPKSDNSAYELCATFRTDTTSSKRTYPASDMSSYYDSSPDTENHKRGEQCFTYKPFSSYYNRNSLLKDDLELNTNNSGEETAGY